MPVLNEDTFALMCLIEQNEGLYADCYRIAAQTLERHPPAGRLERGIGNIAAAARSELAGTLERLISYCDAPDVQEHLGDALIDWRDVAREFIADVLCREDE